MAIALIALAVQSQQSAFFNSQNLITLLRSMIALGMIAFAQMLVILVGEIDLSVGAIYGLSAMLTGSLWLGGGVFDFQLPLLLALGIALVVSLFLGLLNGFLNVHIGIPSFIATLGVLNIGEGLQLFVSKASTFTPAYNQPPPPAWELTTFQWLGAKHLIGSIPVEVLWFFGALLLFWVLRHGTVFGFRLFAIGGNHEAARIARLPVKKYKYIVFAISSLMAGLAGIADFSYVGSVGPSQAGNLQFSAIAAVVIGGASLNGGRGSVIGTLLGVILLALLNNGLALLGVDSFVQLMFIGAVTIIAVWLDILSQKLIRQAGQRSARSKAEVHP